jgi:ankyrin repeat protein
MVRLLVSAGADVKATTENPSFAETPLHWAASTDDAEVAETLIDLGADLEAPGASIAGGPPLDDAVGYCCWQVAHLLVRRGARVDRLWHASALGLLARLEELCAVEPPPTPAQLNQAFWHACSGAQRRTAEYLLSRGADLNFVPDYSRNTPLQAITALETRRDTCANWLRERGAKAQA